MIQAILRTTTTLSFSLVALTLGMFPSSFCKRGPYLNVPSLERLQTEDRQPLRQRQQSHQQCLQKRVYSRDHVNNSYLVSSLSLPDCCHCNKERRRAYTYLLLFRQIMPNVTAAAVAGVWNYGHWARKRADASSLTSKRRRTTIKTRIFGIGSICVSTTSSSQLRGGEESGC